MRDRNNRPAWLRYSLTIIIFIMAVSLRFVLIGWPGARGTFVTFYPAVIISALFGGFFPGLLATALCSSYVIVWWLPAPTPRDWLVLMIFVGSSVLISFITSALHHAQVRANKAEEQARLFVELERAEKAVRRVSEELEVIFNSVPATIWYKDTKNNLIRVNKAAADFVGLKAEDIPGKSAVEIFPLDAEKFYRDDLEVLASGKPKMRIIERAIDLSGVERWVKTDKLPIKDANGKITGILVVSVDVTDLRQTQQALQQSESSLRFLSSQLLSAHEKERIRIARELHDSLGSSLAAIKMGLENTREQLKQAGSDSELLDPPIEWTRLTIEEIRRIMTDLRPPVLDDMGVIAALDWFFRQYRTTYPKIHVEAEIGIEEQDIPEPLRIVIFRIVQEAFHNIAKYSKAEYVDFSLVKLDDVIRLTVEDNGEGFDLQEVLSNIGERKGIGLASMQERAELSGGSFTIRSVQGTGTVVNVTWPRAS